MAKFAQIAMVSAALLTACGTGPVTQANAPTPSAPAAAQSTTDKVKTTSFIHLLAPGQKPPQGVVAFGNASANMTVMPNAVFQYGQAWVNVNVYSSQPVRNYEVQWSAPVGMFQSFYTIGGQNLWSAMGAPLGIWWLNAFVTVYFEDGTEASGNLSSTVDVYK